MTHSPTPADHHAAAQSLLRDAMEQRNLGHHARSGETASFAQVHALLAISGQMLDSAALSLSKHVALYAPEEDEDVKAAAFDEVIRSAADRLGISPHGIA